MIVSEKVYLETINPVYASTQRGVEELAKRIRDKLAKTLSAEVYVTEVITTNYIIREIYDRYLAIEEFGEARFSVPIDYMIRFPGSDIEHIVTGAYMSVKIKKNEDNPVFKYVIIGELNVDLKQHPNR